MTKYTKENPHPDTPINPTSGHGSPYSTCPEKFNTLRSCICKPKSGKRQGFIRLVLQDV